jgi:hypothetical protein
LTSASIPWFPQKCSLKALSDELKEAKQRHEMEQQKIEQKFKSNISIMNQAWMLIQQTQQSMIAAMSQTIFSTCTKVTENLYAIVDKLKSHTNNNEFDNIIHHISSQFLYVNEAHKEYCQHQEEFKKKISTKQNEPLNIFFKNDNV